MNKRRMITSKSLKFLVFIIFTTSCSSNFLNVKRNAETLKAYEKFELTFDLPKTYNNPYDFNEIEVTAIFTNPDGKKIEVPGFWYENFKVDEESKTVAATGQAKWMVRFTPRKAGKWSYVLQARDAEGIITSKMYKLEVMAARGDEPGFIRIHPKNRQYFYYEHSGKTFFAAGLNSDENLLNKKTGNGDANLNWGTNSGYLPQWSGSPTKGLSPERLYDGYRSQVDIAESLGKYGGKGIRINTDRYYHPIEAKASEFPYDSEVTFGEMGFEIGKYHQGMCFILDKMYEASEKYGIGIMHTPWDAIAKQPYGAGFNYAMKRDEELIKRRLRYTMARWGYSTSYWMTEYFNEFVREKLDTFWLGIMEWQKSIDPYNHYTVLTNKRHGETGPDIYLENAYDTACYKYKVYTNNEMPGVIGEFGESIWLGTKDPFTYDPEGHWVRQSHWNALVSNWSGALVWWTKPLYGAKGVDAYDKIYPALNMFLEKENMADEGPWIVMDFKGDHEGFDHVRLLVNSNKSKAFLWIVRTPPSETKDREALSGKWIEMDIPDGTYRIEWWNSQTGEIVSTEMLESREGKLKISVPGNVTRDIAAKIIKEKR